MKIRNWFKLLAISLLTCFNSVNANSVNVNVNTANDSITVSKQMLIKTELASPVVLEDSQNKNYLKVSLTGFGLKSNTRSPINLALVIDRSTSMSGDRIVKAREAAILAVNMLNDNDTLSIVAYDNSAEVIIPSKKVKNKAALIKIINQQIHPQGMTALFAGVSKGIAQVNKNLDREQVNRIILLSDGQANVGPTSIKEVSELARMAAKKGIAITTIGLGSDYNEDLMTAIAGYSDGNHAFVANSTDLEAAFSREFKDVMSVVAQEVMVTINLDPSVKPIRLLGRDGDIIGNKVKVKLNQLYFNQEKYVLLEVLPAKGMDQEQKTLADVSVSYNNLATSKTDNFTDRVVINYSKSAKIVSDAIVEDVLVDSEIQKAAVANEEAINLIDQGRTSEAKEIISKNANKLSSMTLSTSSARAKAEENARKQKKLAVTMDSTDEASYRKELKEQNYSVQKQQK